jgi:NADH-quinone oxidoreductase chain G
MITIKIDGLYFVVKNNISILQACKIVGIKIPRFCYHELLSIAGNCRMCLVKLEDNDKLVISCLAQVEAGMEILTRDSAITKAREEIIEFLLLDHPMDCPICDQGGECDLQDLTINYGSVYSKFNFNKVGVEDKNLSVFIKTIMTRCIHCTRCVRFSSEIAGLQFFGTLNRGNFTEIGTYNIDFFKSEISGNVVDLCPVGALTSKPYTFKVRPWELKSTETIDLNDSFGTNVYVNFSESKILRILPKYNADINESIISDKSRYYYDAFSSFNLLQNFIENGKKKLNHAEELKSLSSVLSNKKILAVVSDDTNLETLNILKKISKLNSNFLVRSVTTIAGVSAANCFYNINTKTKTIKSSLHACFLVAINPRTETALINTQIRFLSQNSYIKIYNFGCKYDTIFKTTFINFALTEIIRILEAKSKKVSHLIIKYNSLLFLIGAGLVERNFSVKYLENFLKVLNPSIIFLHIFLYSNSCGLAYLNYKPVSTADIIKTQYIFFFSCRETVFLKTFFLTNHYLKNFFWFNTHSINFSSNNIYQIPIKSFFEETSTYLNLEFRPQIFQKFLETTINASSSYSLLKNLFQIKKNLTVHLDFIKEFVVFPEKFSLNIKSNYTNILIKFWTKGFFSAKIIFYPTKPQINDFYKTNYFTDHSKNMLIASKHYQKLASNFF